MSHIASLPDVAATKSGLWRRLLFGRRTLLGTYLDIWFGVVAPIFCFAADPGVMFGAYQLGLQSVAPLFVYALAALSMLALLAWLVFGGRSGALDAVLGGILLAGGVVAFVVGVGVLPWAAIGMIVFIGVLGFIPFFTSFVYVRCAVRALASPSRQALSALGAAAALLLGAGYQAAADRALDVLVGDIATTGSPAAIARLEHWRPLLPRREMERRGSALIYEDRRDPRAKQYEVAYRRVTGRKLQVAYLARD